MSAAPAACGGKIRTASAIAAQMRVKIDMTKAPVRIQLSAFGHCNCRASGGALTQRVDSYIYFMFYDIPAAGIAVLGSERLPIYER